MADAAAVPTGTADAQIYTGRGKLYGFSCRESAGTPAVATFILRDGTTATGTPLAYVELAANGSLTESLTSPVDFVTGLYLDRIAGESEVTAYI